MKHADKKILLVLSSFLAAHSASASVLRDKIDKVAGGFYRVLAAGESGQTRIADFIGLLISLIVSFLGVLFIILIIYAGYLWMTARGNEDQVRRAQNILINSSIGLIVVVMSYALVRLAGYVITEAGFLKS